MSSELRSLFRNPHLLTIAGNFWPRKIDQRRFPVFRKEYRISDSVTLLSLEHRPRDQSSRGRILFLHGLEGSAHAGYIASMSQTALERGLAVHRLNMRTCGGTENLCDTMYHSGLTSDVLEVLQRIKASTTDPLFLVGFSLGGNVALKLAGELEKTDLLKGVAAVSSPIDLAASVRAIDRPVNTLYARRFLDRLRGRIRRKSKGSPGVYSDEGLSEVKTIWDFDERFTAPLFGFGTAANYYNTQSAINFLPQIRVPTLVITAKDDPLVPFDMYKLPVFHENPALTLLATERGGHLGFLSRRKPRFWLDGVVLNWIERKLDTVSDERSETIRAGID